MRAREVATTSRVGQYYIEAKLRFEMIDPLGLEILADQQFKAELKRICTEANMAKAKRCEITRLDAATTMLPTETQRPNRRRPNADRKRALKSASLCAFVQQYSRKAQKNTEPNDRRYDRDIERAIKRMDPVVLDRLLRDDEEED
jgi:hypothetical protein